MGKLMIRVRPKGKRDESRAGAVARIAQLGEGDKTPHSQEVVIPTSYSQYREVYVEPGEYTVEVLLPSGSLLRKKVSIRDGEESFVDLDSSSQHEWLGRQVLAGQRRDYEARPPRVEMFKLNYHLPRLEWASLAKLISSRATPSMSSVVGTLGLSGGKPMKPEYDEGDVELYALNRNLDGRRMRPTLGDGMVAIIERGPTVELVMVPVTHDGWGPMSAELAVARDPAIPLSVAIGHPEFGGLIGYLGAGSLAAGRAMMLSDEALNRAMEFGGLGNPFGAAAAACVLALNETTATRQPWDKEIEHLAERFPGLADGAILLAERRLALARVQADLDGVRSALAEAMRRGIPLFAAAARMLVETMTTLVGDKSVESSAFEGEGGFGALRRSMLRLQPRQAVTVFRFGTLRRSDAPLPAT